MNSRSGQPAEERAAAAEHGSTGGYMFYFWSFGNRLRPVSCDPVLPYPMIAYHGPTLCYPIPKPVAVPMLS